MPRKRNNWGDRDFITVAPDGTLYLTWDYGPSAKKVTFMPGPRGAGVQRVSLTWGSAVRPSKDSEIYATVVTFHGHAG